MGKFLNWFAASLAVSPFPSVPHCLADFALVKLLAGSVEFLTLRKQVMYENTCSYVSKPPCTLVVENKQHKELIDRAKPDDVHLSNSSILLPF